MGRRDPMERRDHCGKGSACLFLQQPGALGTPPGRLSWGRAVSSPAAREGRGGGSSRQGCAVPCPSCARGCAGSAEAAQEPWVPRAQPCPSPRVSSQGPSLHVSTLVLFLFHSPFVFSAVLSQFCVLGCLTSPLCSLQDFAPSLSPLAPLFSVCFPLFAPFPLLFLLIAYFHFRFFFFTLSHSFLFHLSSSFPLALFTPYSCSLS